MNDQHTVSQVIPDIEPWLAINLSAVFPGVGQIYAGSLLKGIVIIFFVISLYCLQFYLFISPSDNRIIGIFIVPFTIIVFIWNLFDAYKCTIKANTTRPGIRQRKTSWLAVFLSQKRRRDIVAVSIFLVFLEFYLPDWFVTTYVAEAITIPSVYSVYNYNGISVSLKSPVIGETAELMRPTLVSGDNILVDKWSYRFQNPQRGDIVAFESSSKSTEYYYGLRIRPWSLRDVVFERIVGLPGEKVEIVEGKIYIKGQFLGNYISKITKYHRGYITVPPDSYFVLGDNRNNNFDKFSVVPFIYRGSIVGKISRITQPLGRMRPI